MQDLYDINHEQAMSLLIANGASHSMLIRGEHGIGKSAIGYAMAEQLKDTHEFFYFDCTTKDLGDVMVPWVRETDGGPVVTMAPNTELGFRTGPGKKAIVMLDELSKPGGGRAMQQSLTGFLLEHRMGDMRLPEGSIVFGTGNLTEEGLGDSIPAHTLDRVSDVTLRKPTPNEWLAWGVNNGVNPVVLSWVKDTPAVLQSFREVKNPDDNPYIFHPRMPVQQSVCTPRSLTKAGGWLDKRRAIGDDTALTAAINGTIGPRGGLDLMAYVTLADSLPKRKDILKNPDTTPVPDNAAAVCMIVFNMLMSIEADEVDPWMEYLNRLNTEAQGLFVNGARRKGYRRQTEVMLAQSFTDFSRENRYLFGGDTQ